ncbi:MAG: amino acid permease [Flavobacteriales bacterium]|nr:amino acid permease [Flavobacteriales bacterium]
MRNRKNKNLGLSELIAISIGGMVGGGIFTILGISVSMIGTVTPVAILIGGVIAFFAAYSYVKLGLYYRDEGATYSFFKKTYPGSGFMAAAIGWLVIFGYISTLALYAYTFSSYVLSSSPYADNILLRKLTSISILFFFALVNVWSVNGMGKLEDVMVYLKLAVLALISYYLIFQGPGSFHDFKHEMLQELKHSDLMGILIVSSITFVAFEGFQLVINAVKEMSDPERNIPAAIYSSIFIVSILYILLSIGALISIPGSELIAKKEYALASGAGDILGARGNSLVIFGAILATASAISGTLFGSSRQMAVIAEDGLFPAFLSKREKNIPRNAILTMTVIACFLILVGGLQLILEFGSITFLVVSLLMAIANFRIRRKTGASILLTVTSILGLSLSTMLILVYEFQNNKRQIFSMLVLYALLIVSARAFSLRSKREKQDH